MAPGFPWHRRASILSEAVVKNLDAQPRHASPEVGPGLEALGVARLPLRNLKTWSQENKEKTLMHTSRSL